MIRYIRNLLTPKSQAGCVDPNCEKVADILYSVIDDEASADEKAFFKDHVDHCTPCLDKLNVEKELLDSVKTKLKSKGCPSSVKESLIRRIKEEG